MVNKRMAKGIEQSNGLFFVQVKEPNEVRRNILEALKEIVELLQKFEKFRHIRQRKIDDIHKLRGLLKDANKMLGNLRAKMPQTNLRAVVAREAPKQHKNMRYKRKKARSAEEMPEKAQKKEATELERLESELSAIESKLKSLT